MDLTGQAKIDFYEYAKNKGIAKHWNPKKYSSDVAQAMIYGVYVDWFDSVGIFLNTIYECSEENCYYYFDGVFLNKYDIGDDVYETRQEARTEAIKKANEIYNNK